jgi:hypothetical protein
VPPTAYILGFKMKGLYKIRKKMRFKQLDAFLIKDTSLMRDPIFGTQEKVRGRRRRRESEGTGERFSSSPYLSIIN